MGTLLENYFDFCNWKILDPVAKNLTVSNTKNHGFHSVLKPTSFYTNGALIVREAWYY